MERFCFKRSWNIDLCSSMGGELIISILRDQALGNLLSTLPVLRKIVLKAEKVQIMLTNEYDVS